MAFMLRRATQNNAVAAGSPARPKYSDMSTNTPPRMPMSTLPNGHTSPMRTRTPITPRTKLAVQQPSPCDGFSISESHEFDWDAVRLHKPPPYGSPMEGARARAARKSEAGQKSGQKRVIKRPGWFKRCCVSSSFSRMMWTDSSGSIG
jgi:hypothetical protein